jgi:hypothetical protein
MDQHESHHEVIYVHSALLFYTVVFSEIFMLYSDICGVLNAFWAQGISCLVW